jgi:hypothetical protein
MVLPQFKNQTKLGSEIKKDDLTYIGTSSTLLHPQLTNRDSNYHTGRRETKREGKGGIVDISGM